MKTILYMTTSLTGKTTSGDTETSWVESADVERMDAEMIACGAMLMGKRTYESFGDELPLGQAFLIVMTHDKELLQKSGDEILFTDKSPKEVLELLEEKGYERVMLAGGESTNSAFLKDNLVNEIRIIIKPLVIGHGKSLFNVVGVDRKATLLGVTQLDNGSVEMAYSVDHSC